MYSGTLVTGSALWILNRSPESIQKYVSLILSRLPARFSNVATLTTIFSWLFGISLVRTFSSILSAAALNNWQFRSDRRRWNWPTEVAVVTGGCSGIGESIVRALAAKGVKVAVLDMAPLPDRLKGVVGSYHKCDVTDPDEVDKAAKEIKTKLGTVSILVNNAGIGHDFPILSAPPARVKKLIEVNLISHWYTCQAFVPDMVTNNKGHIVEIASMSSFISVGHFADYSATKVALISFSESLREQLRTWYKAPQVHVTCVHPLWVATPLVEYRRAIIEKSSGQPMMAPTVVADKVSQQIFRCKGTQLIIPESASFLRTSRAWPAWMLDGLKHLSAIKREDLEASENKTE